MIPQANITAWRTIAPWPDDAQVEQDLAMSRAAVELFADPDLSRQIALRGGTALNKLFIVPGVRYSEDIDLVQTKAGPAGPLIDAIRARIDPWLGKPTRTRNRGSVALRYQFESEIPPVRLLRLKIEVNTREHFTVLGLQSRQMVVSNPWFMAQAQITTYQLNELMGTKLRALYQRRKGRDLFDLWLCLERNLINPDQVIACFLRYMEHEGHTVSRAEFEENLHDKQANSAFMNDIAPLLSSAVRYDPVEAIPLVRSMLIDRLPGTRWRGIEK